MKTLTLLGILLTTSAFAHPSHEPPKMPKDFETLKKLVGTWEGKNKMGDQESNITVVYELTSGGTAIAEKLMPGTDHEMTTIYHKEGNTVGMTHYCAMGNQPHMKLKKGDDHSLAFEMDMKKMQGITSKNESHMHALTLTMADDDTLKQEWQNYDKGKPAEMVVLNFKRKK